MFLIYFVYNASYALFFSEPRLDLRHDASVVLKHFNTQELLCDEPHPQAPEASALDMSMNTMQLLRK